METVSVEEQSDDDVAFQVCWALPWVLQVCLFLVVSPGATDEESVIPD